MEPPRRRLLELIEIPVHRKARADWAVHPLLAATISILHQDIPWHLVEAVRVARRDAVGAALDLAVVCCDVPRHRVADLDEANVRCCLGSMPGAPPPGP